MVSETTDIKENKQDKLFYIINYTLLFLFLIIELYPLIIVLSSSFSNPTAVLKGRVLLWPVRPTLEGYRAVFRHKLIVSGYMNSFFYMITGTLINLLFTILAAYPLSRKNLFGRKVVTFLFTFTMFFGGGLIPFYMVVRDLGMINTRWSLIIPSAVSVWNIIIVRTYFQTSIPEELFEASKIDGCDDFTYLIRIALPLSKPVLAVMALFFGVGHWNSYFNAMIFLNKPDLYPLQLVLRDILVTNTASQEMLRQDPKAVEVKRELIALLKYSLIVVSTLPLLIIYPFVQKYFVKGIMVGSLKG